MSLLGLIFIFQYIFKSYSQLVSTSQSETFCSDFSFYLCEYLLASVLLPALGRPSSSPPPPSFAPPPLCDGAPSPRCASSPPAPVGAARAPAASSSRARAAVAVGEHEWHVGFLIYTINRVLKLSSGTQSLTLRQGGLFQMIL